VSAIYGAGLSTVASGLNSLAAVLFEDFLKPARRHWWPESSADLTEHSATMCVKFLVFTTGCLVVSLAYVFSMIRAPILQIALSLMGICGGPILGVFILGLFFRRANAQGALWALILALTFNGFLGLSPIFQGRAPETLSLSTEKCLTSGNWTQMENFTALTTENVRYVMTPNATIDLLTSSPNMAVDESVFGALFKISYQYYSLVAVMVVLIVGLIVSEIVTIMVNKKEPTTTLNGNTMEISHFS